MKKLLLVPVLLGCLSGTAQSLYGDFETWRNVNVSTSDTVLHAPIMWNGTDSIVFYAQGFFTDAVFSPQVYETNVAHSGTKAAKLVTVKQDTLGVLPALLTNADISFNMAAFFSGSTASALLFSGGTPVASRIPAITAWVRYEPSATDSGFITVQAIKSGIAVGGEDSVIGHGSTYITSATTSYSQLTANITYTDDTTTPDYLRIFISSSGKDPQIGSTLYVDDVNISTLAVNNITTQTPALIYPNPATNQLTINTLQGTYTSLIITSSVGNTIMQHPITNTSTTLDIQSLPAGIYYVTVRGAAGIKAERFVKL